MNIRDPFYGTIFHGSDAALVVDRSGAFGDMLGTGTYFSSERPAEYGTTSLQHVPHIADFLACMRSRKRPAGDIETGFHATLPCHLGNIAYRAGTKVTWDPKAERIANDARANGAWRLSGLES